MLWTNEDVHIERIYPDEVLWLSCVEKAAILPELLGKWYSRPSENPVITLPGPSTSAEEAPSTNNATEVYCYCRGPERGDMVTCDNPLCPCHLVSLRLSKADCSSKKQTMVLSRVQKASSICNL